MIDYLATRNLVYETLKKSHEGQVLVERIETNKQGTTYRHKHWCNPKEMKSGDKVIGGFKNLPKDHPQQLHDGINGAKFSNNGERNKQLESQLGMSNLVGKINDKGQRYFQSGDKTYSLHQISDMLKESDKKAGSAGKMFSTKNFSKEQTKPKQTKPDYTTPISNVYRNGEITDRDKLIDDVMSKATPEQAKLYKSVGLCAGDEKTIDLLKRLQKRVLSLDYLNPNKISELRRIKPDKSKWDKVKKDFYDNLDKVDTFFYGPIVDLKFDENKKPVSQEEFYKKFKEFNFSAALPQCEEMDSFYPLQQIMNKDDGSSIDVLLSALANSIFIGGEFSKGGYHDIEDLKESLGLDLTPYLGIVNESRLKEREIPIKAKISSVSDEDYKKIYKMLEKDFKVGKVKDGYFQRKGTKYTVKGIYKIEGLGCEKDFNDLVKKNKQFADKDYGGKNGQVDYFYHGTKFDVSQRILGDSGEFKIVPATTGSALGKGIYLADAISKSVAYTNSIGTGCVFICEGTLGQCEFGSHVHDIAQSDKKRLETGCDSCGVPAGTWEHNEWKVNNAKAAIPRFYVEIEVED